MTQSTKKMPINIKGVEICPDCIARGEDKLHLLVFGMRSDGRFHDGKKQQRKRFDLVRPVIATKACNTEGCGYWWPAFSFTPQQIMEAAAK